MKAGVVIGHLKYGINEGALLRTAEAFGLNNVFVLGNKAGMDIVSSACGADRHMIFTTFETVDELIEHLISNNYNVVAVEDSPDAVELSNVIHYPVNPVFVSGHENNGVPDELLRFAKMVVKIGQGPGYVRCLNTGVAFGIVVHDFFKKVKQ